MSRFGRGALPASERRGYFEFANLPDVEKRDLCRGLLEEFGARNIHERDGELIHSCPLPNGGHRNGDRNPSASLNWKRLTFNCLGCGSQGGLLWFIATCRNTDGVGAREWLTSNSSFGQSTMDLSKLIEVIGNIYARGEDRAPIPRYDPSVLDPWFWDEHHPYLTIDGQIPGTRVYGRGICPETLDHFRVGYADEYFDGTDRIIIPLFWKEHLVGWQARCLPGYDGSDKYRNSPDFPRDEVLYNHHEGRSAVLVESPMSVLRHYHHRPDFVGTFGAKVGVSQIQNCHRYDRVALWFDNDKAGWEATKKVGHALARHVRVSVIDSPWAADPADMDDAEVTRLLTEHQVPLSVWKQPTRLREWERN